jgi:hypothetical protein
VAIYFLNLKNFGRANGSSAVSLAAYRAGERIHDERSGRTYDHSGRQGVLHKEIMLPNEFAAAEMSWAKDRNTLWNSAENAEVRSGARVAREYLVALPAELSPQARINLVAGFSRELVERYRFALDIAIHAPRDYPGSDPRNFHAHLLATTREVTPTGLGAKTSLEWSDTHRRQAGLGPAVGELLRVREQWAMAANTALEQEHINARIDHRTLKAQGIDREPNPHIPHAAFEMERHGYHSVVAERIRAQYQARLEARIQHAAQREQSVAAPKGLADKAKEFALRWFRYWQAQEQAEPKSPERPAKESIQKGFEHRRAREVQPKSREALQNESAQRRVRSRRPQEEARSKRPQDLAKESALRWAAKYGQEAKSSRDIAMESALRWKERYDKVDSGSSRDIAMESALRWKERYDKVDSGSSRDIAMESALRWKERYDKVDSGSSRDIAMESALRWKERYGQGAQESPEATAKESAPGRRYQEARGRGREREQSDPAPTSTKRTPEKGLDLSL